ncbi:hypothetical protein GCM10009676_08720 [Prauserella halophila]|uniref:Integrase catalytic domain-containing protein n=1 Tax=Prauserella halophila TaxID=185641 RepID=A0ABN1W2T5_9PSEU|nr:hypothetical protein [Prauserella halophila]
MRTTVSDPDAARACNPVKRQFTAGAPNRLRVADCTHVASWADTVYVAFANDTFSRTIVGWTVSMSHRLHEARNYRPPATRNRR